MRLMVLCFCIVDVNRNFISPLFVGREKILKALIQALDDVGKGEGAPAIALVAGEAGIGKSRLVAMVRQLATEKQFLILQGRSFDQDRNLPYAPLRDLIFHAKPLRNQRESLSPLIALAGDFAVPLQVATGRDPEAERGHLFETLLEALVFSARYQPVLVILEDLHWSDEGTLDCMLYLERRTRTLPIFYLFTFRSEEMHAPLQKMLADLEREHVAVEFALTRFTPPQVGVMLGSIFGQAHPMRAEFVEAIYTLTDGNPFFVEEVCKALVASQEIVATPGGWSRKAVEELDIPRTVQEAVKRRVERLGEPARRVLVRAAVIGRHLPFTLLEQLTRMNESELLEQVKALLAAQMLVEESADQFAFRHELTRQAVYSSLLLRERRTSHREVAEAIERTEAGTLEAQVSALAYHYDQAQQWQKAFEYSLRAGEQARALYAPRAAVEHYTRALHATQQLQRPPPIGVLRARGSAFETLGNFEAARSDLEEVLEQAHATRDLASEWQGLLDLGFLWIGRDLNRAGDYFQGALELARGLDNPTTLAQTLNRLGNWHMMIEQPLQARQYHAEALQLFRDLKDPSGVAETLDLLGTTSMSAADVVAGIEYYRQAIELFRELENRTGLASALTMLAFTSRQYFSNIYLLPLTDRSGDVLGYAEEAQELVRAIGWQAGESLVLTVKGLIYGARGEYNLALPALLKSLDIATEIEHQQWLVTSNMALGGLYQDLLDLTMPHYYFERALSAARATGSLYWTRTAVGFLAAVYIGQGELQKAKALLDEMIVPEMAAVTMGERHLWTAQAELALATREPAAALASLEREISAFPSSKIPSENAVPRLALLRAKALEQLAQPNAAEQVLQETLAVSMQQGTPPMTWRVHAALAALYTSMQRQGDAFREQRRAQEIVERLTATIPDTELARDFAAEATGQISPARKRPVRAAEIRKFGGLTPREREVAALISQGTSNRAIAARFVLSERTVEKHVENIMSKLGFEARTQIAAWVVESGLPTKQTRQDT